MKMTFAAILLFVLALPAYGADRHRVSEQDARRACMDQAHRSGHSVSDIRSVHREGDSYRIDLRVQGLRSRLICKYDGRKGVQLQWTNAQP
jgi:hypothetical protein